MWHFYLCLNIYLIFKPTTFLVRARPLRTVFKERLLIKYKVIISLSFKNGLPTKSLIDEGFSMGYREIPE